MTYIVTILLVTLFLIVFYALYVQCCYLYPRPYSIILPSELFLYYLEASNSCHKAVLILEHLLINRAVKGGTKSILIFEEVSTIKV